MWALGIQTTKLVTPENSLKFKVLHDKYMDQIFLQLEGYDKTRKKRNNWLKSYKFVNFIDKTKKKSWLKRKNGSTNNRGI